VLRSAAEQYRRQQRITAFALRDARRRASAGSLSVARAIGSYQLAAVLLSLESVPSILEEQGISTGAEGRVNPEALLTGQAAAGMLDEADTDAAFVALVATLVQDAGRTATLVDAGRRPAVTGHMRHLNPPSCPRCAILAGRVYRFSTGFQRHPQCDCLMVLTTRQAGAAHVTDPMAAFEAGQVRGLSRADTEAIRLGADMGQVVNVRRRSAGLMQGSSVMERGGRLTPQGIFRVVGDGDPLPLLRQHGYIV
jgi:hypothetical protein